MFHDSRIKYYKEGEKKKVFKWMEMDGNGWKWMETYKCILNSRKVKAFAIGEY